MMGGYRWISTPDRGEIMEHRYLMEKHLGRVLHTDEIVHHKNRDKTDNRLDNLEVIPRAAHTSSHRAHQLVCLICKKFGKKGAHGLCNFHAQRVRQFIYHYKIGLPEPVGRLRAAKSMIYMALALALESEDVMDRLESLLLKVGPDAPIS
jgi:HNH endonuclease